MRYLINTLVLAFLLSSCDVEGVKTDESNQPDAELGTVNQSVKKGDFELNSEEMKTFDNGIRMNWLVKGEGMEIDTGDVVNINYEVWLKDSTLVESNQARGLKSFPFMVGFGMQTKGWDFALARMRAGDSVLVYLPAELARGEKGYKERDAKTGEIREVIPPNSDLLLVIKAEELLPPTRVVDGNKVWLLIGNNDKMLAFDDDTRIDFHTMVSTPSNPNYVNTFNNKPPFSLRLEDSGVVPGLKKALISAKRDDRMYVYVPSDQAYKSKGFQDLVKPNEPLFYNILVMDVVKIKN